MDSSGTGGWTILARSRRHAGDGAERDAQRAATSGCPRRLAAAGGSRSGGRSAGRGTGRSCRAARRARGGGASEERLQAMAGQLLGLIRDKNATLETALAGLDQLRDRMRALEQMGEPAEARALFERARGAARRLRAGAGRGRGGARGPPRRPRGRGREPGRRRWPNGSRPARPEGRPRPVGDGTHRAAREAQAASGDPAALARRFSGRLDDVRLALEAAPRRAIGGCRRAAALPFAEISEQLDPALRPEGRRRPRRSSPVWRRWRPSSPRSRPLRDPKAALDGFAARLDALQCARPRDAGGEPLRGDLRAADPALRPEGRHGRDGPRPARAAGGAARRDRARGPRPEGGARRLRGAARRAAVAARPAGGEPLRGDLRAADPALRPEGRRRSRRSSPGWRRWRRSSPSSRPSSRPATPRRCSTASRRGSTRCRPGSTSRRRTPSPRSPSS